MFYMMSDHLLEAYKSIYQRKELVSPPKDAEGTQGIMNPQGTPKAAQGGDHARQEVTKGRYRAAYEEYKQELRDYHIEKFIGWVESLDEDGYDISKWELSELSETYIRENNLQDSEEIISEAILKLDESRSVAALKDRYLSDPKTRARRRAKSIAKVRKGREAVATQTARVLSDPKSTRSDREKAVLSAADKGVRKDHFKGGAKLYAGYEPEGESIDENRRAARDPEGRKSGHSKQPDPSKAGFTGIGNMSIDQIRKMSARIEKEKTKKEEFASEGVRDLDPEKGTEERKARLEKKRGMKLDDHPQYKKEDVEQYVDFLIDEGYDCSELTWDDMFEEYASLDEGLRSAVKRLLGKKDAPAEKKPESRGEQLRKKYNIGPERSDTSAKRQILDRTRAKAERDKKEYGGSRYTKSVADKSAAAHDRYLKGGYSKYGADDRRGSGNKARRRAEALKKESFSDWRSEIGLSEEASDRAKDKHLERGGMGARKDYDRPPARKATNAELGIKPGKTAVQKELEKKHGKGASAMDIVKSEIRAKYGKKSIKD